MVWNEILEAGKEFGVVPCGLGARNTLRLEGKLPLYGHEISDTINVWEAGLDRFCKMEKPEFIGRDALEQAKAAGSEAHVWSDWRWWSAASPATATKFWTKPGSEIGYVTSGSYAPFLEEEYRAGLCPSGVLQRWASTVKVEIRGQGVKAKIVPTPFYKRPKKSIVEVELEASYSQERMRNALSQPISNTPKNTSGSKPTAELQPSASPPTRRNLSATSFRRIAQGWTEITAGKTFGTVESVKAVSDLYAPASGTVTEVNR